MLATERRVDSCWPETFLSELRKEKAPAGEGGGKV
jgi:hypothetical protein